jgi:hypothetical protein
MHTFPSASYDDWKLMSPDEEAERLYGRREEDEEPDDIFGESLFDIEVGGEGTTYSPQREGNGNG